jgi:glycosyltransferase involved in cell wall biosynthesis
VYNRETTACEALDSVARQSLLPRRVIIVDDGSTDGSRQALQRWVGEAQSPFARRLICQENRGVSAARNRGLREIGDASCVAFLDSDDLWPANFLNRAVQALHQEPQAVAATCDRRIRDGRRDTFHIESSSGLAENATQWLLMRDAGIASATLFRADVVCRLGGFREDLQAAEDLELFFRLSLQGRWLHLHGAPTETRRYEAERRGEAPHLSLLFPDKCRRAAEVYENFVVRQGGSAVLDRRFYRQVLSKWWYWAGRELLRCGSPVEARECFVKSTRWRFWNKAWWRIGQTYLPRARAA